MEKHGLLQFQVGRRRRPCN